MNLYLHPTETVIRSVTIDLTYNGRQVVGVGFHCSEYRVSRYAVAASAALPGFYPVSTDTFE